jgi:hypothetical protein
MQRRQMVTTLIKLISAPPTHAWLFPDTSNSTETEQRAHYLNKHISLSGTVPRHTAHWETHSSQCGNDLLLPTWWSSGKQSLVTWTFPVQILVQKPTNLTKLLRDFTRYFEADA